MPTVSENLLLAVSETLLLAVPGRAVGAALAQRLDETVLRGSVVVGGVAVGIHRLRR